MVDGVVMERLHEGRQLQTMGGGVGGGRSSAEAGGAEIIYGVRDFRIRPLW
jgi:hypothetical protein